MNTVEKNKITIRKADTGGYFLTWHPSEMSTHSRIIMTLNELLEELEKLLA